MFDNFVRMAESTALQALQGQASAVMIHLESNAPGGIGGMLQQLQAGGLGNQVSSWLAPGANLPVTAEQIHDALSNEHVASLAASMGVPAQQLLQTLADHLPELVSQHAASAS
ncbi:MAG: YidB family protein [Alphaproteobacteria bacterium]